MNRIAPSTGPRPVPEDVRTATQLWWAALAVGVVQVIATVLTQFGQRRELAEEFFDQVRADQPTATLAQVELMVMVVLVIMAVLWLALLGAGAAVVYQLGRGKSWARTVLMVLGVFLVVGGLGALFGPGTGGIAGLVAGGASIVQAVLAAGAVFLCYRAESDAYFRPGPR
ncbi:hypothetical protein [Nocardia sp. CC227C]|uniref:hypothetical protein n=1 Tax=Nocardia sp. CC227C TaxID=3044562 RepID=UPI00278C5E89|nr:hypothetical protein [Nocardia sp. CC227C]